ncbi:MAG: helix-turn-helix domain-containing protein [Bacteroidales bacterium]|nr:helix-turn-helix domain-containing protein [Bacteroidales bacterium]
MSKKIPFLDWKSYVDQITQENQRIGSDLFVVEQDASCPIVDLDVFKSDVCFCVFHEQGSSVIKVNMKEYDVSAPSILIVLPGQVVEAISHSEDLKYKVIVMSRHFCEGLLFSVGETFQLLRDFSDVPVIGGPDDSFIFNIYFDMLANLLKAPENEHKFKAAQHLTLAMFYGYGYVYTQVKKDEVSLNRKTFVFKEFSSLVEKHFQSERKLSFYADKLCVTPKYLSVVTKDLMGVSALRFIEGYVITEAKVLLRSTDLSLQQISLRLNFSTQSDFGKYFKKSTGLSPSAYRKGD